MDIFWQSNALDIIHKIKYWHLDGIQKLLAYTFIKTSYTRVVTLKQFIHTLFFDRRMVSFSQRLKNGLKVGPS